MQVNKRLPARLRGKTWVKLLDGHGAGLLTHVVALSERGFTLYSAQPLPVGGLCELSIMLPVSGREHLLHVRCNVTHCQVNDAASGYTVALAFSVWLSDASAGLELIRTFLVQTQMAGDDAEVRM